MTVAYGLTRYGARSQLDKRLREFDNEQIPSDKLRSVRDYLQESIFDVLKTDVYQGSQQIMVFDHNYVLHILYRNSLSSVLVTKFESLLLSFFVIL